VEFKAKLESTLDCSLRTTLLFDHPRMDLLVDYLIDDMLPLNQTCPKKPRTPLQSLRRTSPAIRYPLPGRNR
jgi:hypothetical protein